MPLRSVTITDDYVEVDYGDSSGPWRFDFADFPPSASSNTARQQHIREHFQNLLDTRIRLKDLPEDDPARLADPGREDFFWDGTGNINTTDLVARAWVVGENSYYNDAESPPLSLELRKAKRVPI